MKMLGRGIDGWGGNATGLTHANQLATNSLSAATQLGNLIHRFAISQRPTCPTAIRDISMQPLHSPTLTALMLVLVQLLDQAAIMSWPLYHLHTWTQDGFSKWTQLPTRCFSATLLLLLSTIPNFFLFFYLQFESAISGTINNYRCNQEIPCSWLWHLRVLWLSFETVHN
jgi:hypothetical protein